MALVYLRRPLDYGDVVGLWLNLPRVLLRQAAPVAHGVGMVFSKAPVPREYFEALAVEEAEADEMASRAQVAREKATWYARHGIDPHG